jgi:hypothetical protein
VNHEQGAANRDSPEHAHQRGADDGGAGAVDFQVRSAAEGEDEIREEEDGVCRRHERARRAK